MKLSSIRLRAVLVIRLASLRATETTSSIALLKINAETING